MSVGTSNELRMTRTIKADRIVYTWDWEDPETAMGETVVTVDFLAKGDSTEVVLVHSGFPAVEAKESHEQGWGACIMRFEGLFH